MSSHPSSGGIFSGLLSFFRYLIGFIERTFKNSAIQAKWLVTQMKWAYVQLNALYLRLFGTDPGSFAKFMTGLLVIVIAAHLAIPLFVWAMLKSI